MVKETKRFATAAVLLLSLTSSAYAQNTFYDYFRAFGQQYVGYWEDTAEQFANAFAIPISPVVPSVVEPVVESFSGPPQGDDNEVTLPSVDTLEPPFADTPADVVDDALALALDTPLVETIVEQTQDLLEGDVLTEVLENIDPEAVDEALDNIGDQLEPIVQRVVDGATDVLESDTLTNLLGTVVDEAEDLLESDVLGDDLNPLVETAVDQLQSLIESDTLSSLASQLQPLVRTVVEQTQQLVDQAQDLLQDYMGASSEEALTKTTTVVDPLTQ